VPVNSTDDVRAILGAIERAGLSLSGMEVRKPNLEEVFLKLAEEHHPDAANEGSK
jgi:ABC-2 type transport system ATP-binding protein